MEQEEDALSIASNVRWLWLHETSMWTCILGWVSDRKDMEGEFYLLWRSWVREGESEFLSCLVMSLRKPGVSSWNCLAIEKAEGVSSACSKQQLASLILLSFLYFSVITLCLPFSEQSLFLPLPLLDYLVFCQGYRWHSAPVWLTIVTVQFWITAPF